MFVAKFNIAQSDPFTADKNGNFPFVGQVLAGAAQSSIVNGTMGTREGIVPNKMYLCENTQVEYANPSTGEVSKIWNTTILSEVSVLEYAQLRTQLGAGRRVAESVETEEAPV